METTRKLITGIFVGACLLLFGVGLFLIGNSNQLFTKAFEVYAEFSKITGVQNGGKVRVGGMDAGTVTRIEVPVRPEGKFRVHFRIVEKLHPIVRQDSVVTIQTDGLLGNKFLQIDAGSNDSPPALDHSMILAKEPFDWGDLMDQINGVVKQANGILTEVKGQLISTLEEVEGTVHSVNGIVKDAKPDVKRILAAADRIGADLRDVMDGIQEGKGTVGALLKDKELYASIRRSVEKGEGAAENVRETAASAKTLLKRVEDSEIVPEIQATVQHVREISRQMKEAVEKFQSAAGEGGVTEDLQRTLANANEVMEDLSDDTEALKHNFLFRGFFNRRGFFDLGSLTAPEYRSAKFAKGFQRHRVWLESKELFGLDAKGAESLTAAGKAKLDEALTAILAFPRNGPMMVEGFAGEGTAAQQYLAGRRRASLVQSYILRRFDLRPAYTGVISLGAERGEGGGFREGVGVVSFYKQ